MPIRPNYRAPLGRGNVVAHDPARWAGLRNRGPLGLRHRANDEPKRQRQRRVGPQPNRGPLDPGNRADDDPNISPNGELSLSPGQRPGVSVPQTICALKGRNTCLDATARQKRVRLSS